MSTATQDETARSTPPSLEDVALAREFGPVLEELAREGEPLRVRLTREGREETVALPAGAVPLIVDILRGIAAGRSVSILPSSAELTTQQAADYLNVSRPFLVRLLDEGKLPFRMVGTHRRVRVEDVVAFKDAIDRDRRAALDALTEEAQLLGLGY